jgi:hypothetical protein
MIGDQIRAELGRPLEGDRRWIRMEEGPFVHRVHPEHIALVKKAKVRARVDEDIRNFRRMLNLRRNAEMLA